MVDLPVEVWQLLRDEKEQDVVILRDEQDRLLPIAIGVCEAAAIWVRLAPELAAPYLRRPWSHDLIQAMLERLGAKLDRVVIDGFSNSTFYATLHISYRGQEVVVDSRPSDAIALLLRMRAPLLVDSEVMEEAGFRLDHREEDENNGDQWNEELP